MNMFLLLDFFFLWLHSVHDESLVALCRRRYSLSLALNLAFQSGERAETHQLLRKQPWEKKHFTAFS